MLCGTLLSGNEKANGRTGWRGKDWLVAQETIDKSLRLKTGKKGGKANAGRCEEEKEKRRQPGMSKTHPVKRWSKPGAKDFY